MIHKEDIEVTVHTVLYILKALGGTADFHKVFKIMYFADQKHLAKYGSTIASDKYIAMKNGPVPSMAYDILKALRGECLSNGLSAEFEKYFEVQEFTAKALIDPDLDNFSESEIEMLDESIKENKSISFSRLTLKSHDFAWNHASANGEIKISKIAKAGGATRAMIEYIRSLQELKYAEFE